MSLHDCGHAGCDTKPDGKPWLTYPKATDPCVWDPITAKLITRLEAKAIAPKEGVE